QWFKARLNLAIAETPRAIAFCDYTIRGRAALVIRDTLSDPRFATNPLVTGEPRIRFYAGAPLISPAGHAIGSIAVLDYEPRTLSANQLRALEMLSHQTVAQLELRKRVAAAMREQQHASHLTSALIGSAIDCVVAIDHEGRFLEFNPAAERTFGYTRAQAIGQDMAEMIVPPDLRPHHHRGFTRHLTTGVQRNLGRRLELTALRADGTRFPIELSIARVEGEPPVFAGFIRDVTERKATEQALKRHAERFELVSRASNDIVWDRDLVAGTIWWSEAFSRVYGALGDVRADDAWLARVHPDDRARVAASLDAAITRQTAWSEEYRFLRPDQQYDTIFDRGYVMYDAEGRATRMVGAMVDLTERRRLEEQVIRSQKMEAIGQLAGGVAHDFNNILTIIECNACMLASADLPADHAASVVEIRQATERAAALTRQLLLISRKQPARRDVARLDDMVVNLSRMLSRVLGEQIVLTTSNEPNLPTIEADLGMLEHVLLNLAVNARDAMPRGGRLSITTSTCVFKQPTAIQQLALPAGRYIMVEVTDTGTGIPRHVLPHIFEPFFTTKDVGKGTGLGLSTVLGVVRQHGGAVDVRTEPDRGTTFTLYLPVLTTPAPPRRRSRTIAMEPGTETLLLVEDEAPLRAGIGAFLRRCGYTTLEAPSAVAAINVWRQHRESIALVVTDIVMPDGMTGRELATMLHRESPTLPIIFTSGYSDDQTPEHEPLVEGMNFLAKPYAPTELSRLIRKRLDET
ncbi:MAG TPA: PAS domain S-box protein, partial [Kofleriaceae bacterium]|nr:PAS domain S-box protein [Kofleriaceae bacterium]